MEMKMTRRIISILLAAIMILALAACGSSNAPAATQAPAEEAAAT